MMEAETDEHLKYEVAGTLSDWATDEALVSLCDWATDGRRSEFRQGIITHSHHGLRIKRRKVKAVFSK